MGQSGGAVPQRNCLVSPQEDTKLCFGIQYYVVFNTKLEVTSSSQVTDKHFPYQQALQGWPSEIAIVCHLSLSPLLTSVR